MREFYDRTAASLKMQTLQFQAPMTIFA